MIFQSLMRQLRSIPNLLRHGMLHILRSWEFMSNISYLSSTINAVIASGEEIFQLKRYMV